MLQLSEDLMRATRRYDAAGRGMRRDIDKEDAALRAVAALPVAWAPGAWLRYVLDGARQATAHPALRRQRS